VSAVAPTIELLVVAAGVVALGAVVSPLMVAFGATLSASDQRGRVTGKIMSGVLVGVLLARTGGGLVAQWFGWRAVYALAAVLVLVLAVVLHRVLPTVPPAERVRYPALLASTARLLKEEPQLRLRSAYAFLSLAGFNAFWTSLAFLLAEPPYSYSEAVIGLFGVVGAVGALAARVAGRLVDRGKEHLTTGLLLTAVLLSWGLVGVDGGGLLPLLLLGVVVIDFGVQGMQVANLGVVYRLRPEARSRLTTAYLTVYFIGGVTGAGASGAAYAAFGWRGVCLVGAVIAAAALVLFAAEQLTRRRRRR
jgi:predicted MFS family arabinose efflux permease